MTDMKFADKLDQLIAARGTSQSRLARETGIGQTAISAMTRGERRPYADQALILARALGVSADYLIDDEQDRPPGPVPTELERRIWEAVRTLGPDEAWRRLLVAPDDVGRKPIPFLGGVTPPGRRGSGQDAAGEDVAVPPEKRPARFG